MADLQIQEIDGGTVFAVKVIPGAGKTCLCGLLGDKLKIKVCAVAEKGRANKCLLDFLSKQLGVKKKDAAIIAGQTTAVKHIRVQGISAQTLLNKLNLQTDS